MICTEREHLAHQILYTVLAPLSQEAARLLPEAEAPAARLAEQIEERRLYQALEIDHPGLRLLRTRADGVAEPLGVRCWWSQGREVYVTSEGLSVDGPAVGLLVAEWLDRIEKLCELLAAGVAEAAAREAAQRSARYLDAADLLPVADPREAYRLELAAWLEGLGREACMVAAGHRQAAEELRRRPGHWRALWAGH